MGFLFVWFLDRVSDETVLRAGALIGVLGVESILSHLRDLIPPGCRRR